MEEKTYPQTWYVYTLAYPESMGGYVFYVGKGTGNRIKAHEQEARSGCGCKKCCAICLVWKRGEQIVKSIAYRTCDENDALRKEEEMLNDKNILPFLTNVQQSTWRGKPERLPRTINTSRLPDEEIVYYPDEDGEISLISGSGGGLPVFRIRVRWKQE